MRVENIMRMDKPRIEPLSRENWDADVLHIVDPNGDRDDADIFNIFKTDVQADKCAFEVWIRHRAQAIKALWLVS